jgi:hypothetical protein
MHLRIDPGLKPPGPAWLMFEGNRPGDGYELHWHPGRLSLTLGRCLSLPSERGHPSMVLGIASLDHFPQQVMVSRQGFHLEVWADDVRVLSILDPQTTAAATSWGFQAAGPMEGSTVSLHDDRRMLAVDTAKALAGDAAARQRLLSDATQSNHALFITREALLLDADKAANDKAAAVKVAAVAVSAYSASDPALVELRQWLAWGETHVALVRQDLDAAARTTQALRQLITLTEQHRAEESAGLLMELLDRLTKACARPPSYRAPEDVVRWRDAWFSALTDCANAALFCSSPAIPDDWRWQLRLIAHGAHCLRGRPPMPTPAEAPGWVVSRWRAFAGGNPGGVSFANPLAQDEFNPVRAALDRLIQLAAFEPGGLPAVTLRAAIIDALDTPAPPNAGPETIDDQRRLNRLHALDAIDSPNAPARESALSQAILALRGIGDPQLALQKLDLDEHHRAPTGDGSEPLARRDALAYALYRLLRFRFRSEAKVLPESPFSPRERLPEALISPFGRLLSGQREALQEAWSTDPTVLPPVQALAAALAMQEVLQGDTSPPNWSLLDQLPCFTLPLHLMKPVSVTPNGRQPDTPVVVP